MVIIGTDSHKHSHTVVAVDGNGRRLATLTVATTPAGHRELLRWAAAFAPRTWALEDCRHLTRRLESDLLVAGEQVLRVPTRLMALVRASGREPGKSDPIDALAVARAALRETDLPVARLEGTERALRLLVDHREDLIGERTRHANRLRWYLVELAIEEPPARSLNRRVVLDGLLRSLAGRTEPAARFARDLVARIRELSTAIDALEREIRPGAASLAPSLLAMSGCGPLSSATIVGRTAGVTRFRSAAAFARHTGTAPIPVWSGNVVRHRLSRGGDRQLNAALHRIAVTQLRLGGRSRDYVEMRRAAGDTKTEALRALKRRLSDEVYRRLRADAAAALGSSTSLIETAA
jgi:transposase